MNREEAKSNITKGMKEFYIFYFYYKRIYEHITLMATAEGLPCHIRPIEVRFDSLEQERIGLEERLDKVRFNYEPIKRKAMEKDKKMKLVDYYDFSGVLFGPSAFND